MINTELPLTGKGESSLWKTAEMLSDFSYPWEGTGSPFTSFKALHNNEWLYCLYHVADDNVKIYVDTNDKNEILCSDRVELFFRTDDRMSPYYCLEIDPLARIFDCKGAFYRKLDTGWCWPEDQLVLKTNRTREGYTVEIAIGKSSLKALGLLKGNTLEAGLFRAHCTKPDGKNALFRWISWVNPKSEIPDFHIPSSFGLLYLEN